MISTTIQIWIGLKAVLAICANAVMSISVNRVVDIRLM